MSRERPRPMLHRLRAVLSPTANVRKEERKGIALAEKETNFRVRDIRIERRLLRAQAQTLLYRFKYKYIY